MFKRLENLRRPILTGLLLCAPVSPAAAAAPDPVLHLADAIIMAKSAVDQATSQGRKISVVILNAEGRTIVSQRMDGAPFFSLDVAAGKATTAIAVGVPTALLQQALAGGDASVLSVPGVIAIAGGMPVVVDGKTIAAVGVSGSMPVEDEKFATAARDRFLGAISK